MRGVHERVGPQVRRGIDAVVIGSHMAHVHHGELCHCSDGDGTEQGGAGGRGGKEGGADARLRHLRRAVCKRKARGRLDLALPMEHAENQAVLLCYTLQLRRTLACGSPPAPRALRRGGAPAITRGWGCHMPPPRAPRPRVGPTLAHPPKGWHPHWHAGWCGV